MKKILLSVFLTLFVSYTAHGESSIHSWPLEQRANVPEGPQPVTSMIIDNLDTPIIIPEAVRHSTLRQMILGGRPGGISMDVPINAPIYEMNLTLSETTPRRFCEQYRATCDRQCRIGIGCSEALMMLVDNNNHFLERIKAGVTTATARCNWDEPAQEFTVLVTDMQGSGQRRDLISKWIIGRNKGTGGWTIARINLHAADHECRNLGINSNECYNLVRGLCDNQNQAADLYQSLYRWATHQN